MRSVMYSARCLALLFVSVAPLFAQDGPSVYGAACGSCHDTGIDRAPNRAALMAMTPERVLACLGSGWIIYVAATRWDGRRRGVGECVTGTCVTRWVVP